MNFLNKTRLLLGGLALVIASGANAGLIDSELSVQVVFQATPDSPATALGITSTATVSDGIEFPDLSNTQLQNGANLIIPPVQIDVGDDFFEFRALGVGGTPEEGFFNGLVFTFGTPDTVSLIQATVDAFMSSGFDTTAVRVDGNQLFINVAGQSFGGSDVLRIDLVSEVTAPGGPVMDDPVMDGPVMMPPPSMPVDMPSSSVPTPPMAILMLLGLLGLQLTRSYAQRF